MEWLEFEILGQLYFVEPFEKVLEEVPAEKTEIKDALRNLISQHYVAAYVFNMQNNRFEQTAVYDTDKLEDYCFSATQKGITAHSKGPDHG